MNNCLRKKNIKLNDLKNCTQRKQESVEKLPYDCPNSKVP